MNKLDALHKIMGILLNGGQFGKWYDCTNPMLAGEKYWSDALHITDDYKFIKWSHFGSSANNVTLEDLDWIISTIFETTPQKFLQAYEIRY